jgi:hypothetical protein
MPPAPARNRAVLVRDPDNPWLLTAWRAFDGQLSHCFHDPDGRLIAVQRGSDRFYVATDIAGSPRVVTLCCSLPRLMPARALPKSRPLTC